MGRCISFVNCFWLFSCLSSVSWNSYFVYHQDTRVIIHNDQFLNDETIITHNYYYIHNIVIIIIISWPTYITYFTNILFLRQMLTIRRSLTVIYFSPISISIPSWTKIHPCSRILRERPEVCPEWLVRLFHLARVSRHSCSFNHCGRSLDSS